MKCLYKNLAIVVLILAGGLASAQKVELIPFGGYTFRNKVNITGGDLTFKDGPTYGGILRLEVRNDNYLEIMYSWQETFVTGQSIYFNETYRSAGAFNYLMIGSTQKLPVQDAVDLYGGLKLGAGWLTAEAESNNEVRFSVGANAGVDFWLSDAIGIQVGMHLFLPVSGVGASFGWSSSGGTGVGVTAFSPIVQFGFDGGLVLRLGS